MYIRQYILNDRQKKKKKKEEKKKKKQLSARNPGGWPSWLGSWSQSACTGLD